MHITVGVLLIVIEIVSRVYLEEELAIEESQNQHELVTSPAYYKRQVGLLDYNIHCNRVSHQYVDNFGLNFENSHISKSKPCFEILGKKAFRWHLETLEIGSIFKLNIKKKSVKFQKKILFTWKIKIINFY